MADSASITSPTLTPASSSSTVNAASTANIFSEERKNYVIIPKQHLKTFDFTKVWSERAVGRRFYPLLVLTTLAASSLVDIRKWMRDNVVGIHKIDLEQLVGTLPENYLEMSAKEFAAWLDDADSIRLTRSRSRLMMPDYTFSPTIDEQFSKRIDRINEK